MIHSATVNIEVLYICRCVLLGWSSTISLAVVVVFSLRPNLVHLIGALNLGRWSPQGITFFAGASAHLRIHPYLTFSGLL